MDDERIRELLEKSDDVLIHYGVPGMKWGVRKDRSSGGTTKRKKKKKGLLEEIRKTYQAKEKAAKAVAEAKKATAQSSSKQKTETKKRPTYKELSDADLRNLVQRMSLEKQYRQLSSEGQKGKITFSQTAKKVGQIAAKSAAVVGVLGGAKALSEKYGLTEQQAKNLEQTLKILEIIGR